MSEASAVAAAGGRRPGEGRLGMLLVFLSALAWSFGGTIGRFVEAEDVAFMKMIGSSGILAPVSAA